MLAELPGRQCPPGLWGRGGRGAEVLRMLKAEPSNDRHEGTQ